MPSKTKVRKSLPIAKPDCRSCGACCVGIHSDDDGGWADCEARDLRRMSANVRKQLVVIPQDGWSFTDKLYATPTTVTPLGKVCNFLRGTPGRKVSCRIYDQRPDVCRQFEPGSQGCLESRQSLQDAQHAQAHAADLVNQDQVSNNAR